MLVGHLIGGSLIAAGVIKWLRDTPERRFQKKLEETFEVYGFENIDVLKVKPKEYGYQANILLPHGTTVEAFKTHLEGIEQSTVSKIKFQHKSGRICSLEFGMKRLDVLIPYEEAPKKGMKIPLATHFGYVYLDFQDGASCHLIGGGATRMGKTCLQLLIGAHLYSQSHGSAHLIISSAKDADYYMFRNLPNVTVTTPEQTLTHLQAAINEYKRRKQIINQLGNVNDAKTVKDRYPDQAFTPLFVIIDEVAVFSPKVSDDDIKKYNQKVQEAMTEIAERAGYVDIHLIIFSQRPDARDVLDPRIKTNMLTRVALTTANAADSKIILGIEGQRTWEGSKAGPFSWMDFQRSFKCLISAMSKRSSCLNLSKSSRRNHNMLREKDHAILSSIANLHFMTTHQVHALHGYKGKYGKDLTRKKLKKLEDQGLLKSWQPSVYEPKIFYLTKKGRWKWPYLMAMRK